MARPSIFTPDVDAVILATSGKDADEVNAELEARGLPSSYKPEQLKQRRWNLTRGAVASPNNLEHFDLAGLARLLEETQKRDAAIEREAALTKKRLAEVKEELRRRLEG